MQPVPNLEPIPGYVIDARVGVGGYGEVWSARAPGGLAKAIKFVYGHFDDERAARELKALNRIKEVRHPFLLSLERYEILDGQLIIVTELAEGSLKDRFEQAKKAGQEHIPREELLGLLHDAADALDYMNENFSLQHLDVKPENLLLIGGRIKVADFGLVKELQDVTASLMGGLTPVYASPEVFDGRPSQRSDQYSLAIVYQEMLTAVLPFPGRTAAQLASQHLHARPRLAPLPAADQPIIARALSKDPAQRYPNCRALIEALTEAGRPPRSRVGGSDADRAPKVDPKSETTSVKSGAAKTDTDWQRTHPRPQAAPASQDFKTQVIGGGVPQEWAKGESAAAPLPVAAEVVDLAPLEWTPGELELRPTLFLGIGGTAAQTLRQLRRRLRDRFGGKASVPAIQMLLLDTDSKALYSATQGDSETALRDRETLSLPLRTAHDYTVDSRNILQWLSRRWLYNIPRSLQTEGRRPLGRLALVDHAGQVVERLRKALLEITSAEATSTSATTTGLRCAKQAPRVYLISSISGGTGSGMALDVAYMIRKVLAELNLSDDGLCGILTHSTDRNPSTSDVAIANAYACLSELSHYSGPESFPGDASCALPATEPGTGTFPHVYFVHLGHNLSDRQFEQATEDLSAFLYLNTVTNAGAALEQCRALTPQAAAAASLRSIGVACVGTSDTLLPTLATELLCNEVLARWRGTPQEVAEQPAATSLIEIAAQREQARERAIATEVEHQAAEHARQTGIEFEKLQGEVVALLEGKLGGDAQAVFADLCAKIAKRQEDDPAGSTPHLATVLQTIANLFDPPPPPDDPRKTTPPGLRAVLEQDVKLLAAPKGDAARQWIVSLIERPGERVGGACRAKEWYANHLRALEAHCTERLHKTHENTEALVHILREMDHANGSRGRVFKSRRPEKPSPEIEGGLLRLVGLRMQETAMHGMCKLLRLIGSSLSSAGDQLKDLQRELNVISQAWIDDNGWEKSLGETARSGVIDDVRFAVARSLRCRMPRMAEAVDERLQTQFLAQQGGLGSVFRNAEAMRSTLPNVLRDEARAEVVRALKGISFVDAILTADSTATSQGARLRTCIEAALPRLAHCGGSRHLLAILPESATGTAVEETLATELDPRPTIVRGSDADLVFCYDVQELAIPYVAAQLIVDRTDFVQIAARLHTRTDITWCQLPQVALGEPQLTTT